MRTTNGCKTNPKRKSSFNYPKPSQTEPNQQKKNIITNLMIKLLIMLIKWK